jgi:hypothetical protein
MGILLASSTGCSPQSRQVSVDESTAQPSGAASPSVTATQVVSDARALGAALEYMSLRPAYSSDEPRGDLGKFDTGFVRIASVTASAQVEVSFDVEQFYQGSFARVEASKDKVRRLEGDYYLRNRYRHIQTLPIAPDATIVLQSDGAGRIYGIAPESGQGLEVVSPSEFARRFAQPIFRQERNLEWLGVDDGKIVFIMEQFFP